MHRRLALVAVFVLVIAACSDSGSDSTTAPTGPGATSATDPPTGGTTPTAPPSEPDATPAPTGAADPVAGGAGIGDDYYSGLGNSGYDVQHYSLDLDFDPTLDHLEATAAITAVAERPLSSFNLDFDGLDLEAITVDGADAEFVLANEELTITPVASLGAGERFVVEASYSGTPGPVETPALSFSMGWFNNSFDQTFVVAEPDAAHTWFPSNDHPLDKATFDFRITVPDGVVAAANGTLLSSAPNGDGTTTWEWQMDDPMATYLATVVIGDFEIVVDEDATADAGVPIRHVLPTGATIGNWPGLDRQGEMLAFLADLFGPYPFDNYGIAIVEEFGAALETQTLSVFGTRMTNPDILDRVLIHELAHQWFGNSVSPAQWSDVWLNEGFASYAEWLWFERGSNRSVLDISIEGERAQFATFGLPPPGAPPPHDLFNGSVYRVGAMTLHALRLTVGDDDFFDILRTYHSRFAGGAATTEDFIAVAESVSGEDLGDLFDAWLFGLEIPEFP